jgi:hypothetical protein
MIPAGIRQLRFPKEFRIAPSAWSLEVLPDLHRLVESLVSEGPGVSEQSAGDPAAEKGHLRFLADLGTGLWRLRQKMVQPGTEQPLENMQRAYRHFQATWDVLSQAGLEVRDHTGTPYDAGLSITVIAFEPTPGVGREMVVETIKPTIYYKSQRIQRGEVIVGTPVTAERVTGGSSQGADKRV